MTRSKHSVRGEHGRLPANDPGVSIHQIKEWREIEHDAGRPSSLEDFYTAHGLCPECRGRGVRMIGWSKPVDAAEFQVADEIKLDELPLYAVCSRCSGTGSAERNTP